MDEVVLQAMRKWPNVPALFGWLRLDRRGNWYLRGVRIDREVLAGFIGRNYERDEYGRYYFQNGPQRGFVELEYTPWVLQANPDGRLSTHTAESVGELRRALLDEGGSLLLEFDRGIGLLSDTDLDWAVRRLRGPAGELLDDAQLTARLERLQRQGGSDLSLEYEANRVPLERIESTAVPEEFGFVREPAPLEDEKG